MMRRGKWRARLVGQLRIVGEVHGEHFYDPKWLYRALEAQMKLGRGGLRYRRKDKRWHR